MKSDIKTYVDESGNTGKNLVDLKQPFFSIGAVLIKDGKLKDFESILNTIPENLKDPKGEIKGNNIVCYAPELALKFISEIIPKYSEMVFFSVLEKSFMIAGQIVENFFDYAYNDKTDVYWTYKSKMKINLANFFYNNLTQETLKKVHYSFVSAQESKIRESYLQIIKEIDGIYYEFDIISLLKGADKHIKSLSEDLASVNQKNNISKGVPKNTIATPNVTSYFELICRVEKFLENEKTKSKIIFDNSEQFNEINKELITRMKNAPRKKVYLSEKEYIKGGFKYLTDFEVKESTNTIGLQIVDIFTSIVNHIFTKTIVKSESELTQTDIYLTSIIGWLTIDLGCGYWTTSKSVAEKIGNIMKKFK